MKKSIILLSILSIGTLMLSIEQPSINTKDYTFISTIDTKESSHRFLWQNYICILKRHKETNTLIAHCLPSVEGKEEKILDVSYTTCEIKQPNKILIGTTKNPQLGKTDKLISPYCYIWARENKAHN